MGDELSKRTVKELRELARAQLGKGHASLKTKDELVSALSKAKPSQRKPVEEGFFAKETGSEAPVRPAVPRRQAGKLAELRPIYQDDAELLLPRDPRTLFFLWDYSSTSIAQAKAGMESPRSRLRVLEGDRVVRELDVPLEARSFYINDLIPGRTYRVEAFFLDKKGHHRRIGKGSQAVTLPPEGPSADLRVEAMRVPWGLSLSHAKRVPAERLGAPQVGTPPERVPLPSSQNARPAQAPPAGPAPRSRPSSQTSSRRS